MNVFMLNVFMFFMLNICMLNDFSHACMFLRVYLCMYMNVCCGHMFHSILAFTCFHTHSVTIHSTANDDVNLPTSLVGKKIAPIYEFKHSNTVMGESLDIIAKVDSDSQFGPVGLFRPESGREDIKIWQSKTKDTNRYLYLL